MLILWKAFDIEEEVNTDIVIIKIEIQVVWEVTINNILKATSEI